jgi:hypothetical protein
MLDAEISRKKPGFDTSAEFILSPSTTLRVNSVEGQCNASLNQQFLREYFLQPAETAKNPVSRGINLR